MGKYHIGRWSNLKKIISLALAVGLAFSFALPASASGRIDFIDVSHYQSESGLPLSVYQTAKAGHIDGVVVKVSEGTSRRDPAAAVNIANARAADLRVSVYHFGHLTSVSEAQSEARWFDKNLQADGFSKTADGYAVLDIEDASLTRDASQLTDYVNAFLDELHKLGYVKTDVYSGSHYYGNRLIPSKLDNNQPWLARYAFDGRTVLDPGYNRGAHQWSSTQKLFPGYGYFDVNIDYAGKYTGAVSSKVGKVGGVSLVNYLKSKKINSSFANRTKLAVDYGIVVKMSEYKGTAAQNIALLANIKAGRKPSAAAISAVKKTTEKVSATENAYVVRRGDTLSSIGERLGVSYRTIMSFNGLHSWLIYPGEKLRLMAATSKSIAKTSTHIYTVHRGDSLWKISRAKHTSVSHLKFVNHLHSDLIKPGEKIKY
ncbi:GH25 family lysozyme [Sporolactobacillus pectinivorans]|uniref:GH25 family lysozyme n=1 Tax=Sporolactobacillus pectinivorans TaxID=1591408 RepID=UPI000C25F468|nr:GH25 family lysozyme [Sporolactobacillus pectinivorans]